MSSNMNNAQKLNCFLQLIYLIIMFNSYLKVVLLCHKLKYVHNENEIYESFFREDKYYCYWFLIEWNYSTNKFSMLIM